MRICRGYIYRLYYLTGEGEEESGGEVHDDRSPPMVTEETAGALCDGAVESSSEVPPSMPAAKGKRGGKGRMVVKSMLETHRMKMKVMGMSRNLFV